MTNNLFTDEEWGPTAGLTPDGFSKYLDTNFPVGGRYAIADDGDARDAQEIVWHYGQCNMTWTMSCSNSFGFALDGARETGALGVTFTV